MNLPPQAKPVAAPGYIPSDTRGWPKVVLDERTAREARSTSSVPRALLDESGHFVR